MLPASMFSGTGKSVGKGKGKGKAKASAKQAKEDAPEAEGKEIPSFPYPEFLTAVGWSEERFLDECRTIVGSMDSPTDRPARLSPHRGTRLLSMSVLEWNRKSHNKQRDFAPIVVVVAVESASIGQYRKRLLDVCPGARDLREDIHELLLDLAAPHSSRDSSGNSALVRVWEFSDNISSEETTGRKGLLDPDVLMEEWQDAYTLHVKDVKNPVVSLIRSLEKSKLLACSDPGSRAIETLAHALLSGLIDVCPLIFVCHHF